MKKLTALLASIAVVVVTFGFLVQAQSDHAAELMQAEQIRLTSR